MRRALFAFAVVAAAALGGSVTSHVLAGSDATAAPRTLESRVASLESKVTGICTAFRAFERSRAYHDFDRQLNGLIRSVQTGCGQRTVRRRHEDRRRPAPPQPPPRHEG